MHVPMGKKAPVVLACDAAAQAVLQECEPYLLRLAQAAELSFVTGGAAPDKAAKAHVRGVDIYLPLAGLIDLDKEISRIEKEIASTENELKRLAGKLANASFLAKAPAEVVEKERAKETEYQAKLDSLRKHLQLFR